MPYVRIWIHFVWSTKIREPLLTDRIRRRVFNHITEYAKKKGILLDTINGGVDHAHLLISLGATQTVADIAQLLKGESSWWVNSEHLTPTKFEWQDEYYAVSVSESMVDVLRAYIRNQDEHHRTKTFSAEYVRFIRKHGFENRSK